MTTQRPKTSNHPPAGSRPKTGGASGAGGAGNAKPRQIQNANTKSQQRARTETPRQVPTIYGAEALAALTVSESKRSRLKGRFILALLVMLAISLGWNSVQSAFRPEPKLLGITSDGRVQPLPLLDAPIDSRQTLLDWTRRNIPSLYDFNYSNYKSQIGKARDFVQQVTLKAFQEDLDSSGILSKVKDEFLLLRANIVNEPVITSESTVNGRRLWVMEVPMSLIYDSGEVRDGKRRQITQDIIFTAWIVRANILEYDGGLMLAKYSVKARRT